MPGSLIHIADRLYGRPLFLHPGKAEVIASVLAERTGGTLSLEMPSGGIEASRLTGSRARLDGSAPSLFRQERGVALIPVIGSLVNRGAWLDANSGLTSYEGITAQVKSATADPAVKAIMLDIDSPGGEATGMFSLAAAIRQADKVKPVVAVVNDVAASAAYGIASAAREIVISPTSVVGSIGVVMLHVDRSAEMAQKGVRATLIHAGAHKVDGHPFGPLSAEVAADLQRDVMAFYDRFLDVVADGRGARLTAAQARGTEARTFIGADAIKQGLADRTGTFDETLERLATSTPKPARLGAARANFGASKMDDDMISRAEHDAAIKAARDDGFKAGMADGEKHGAAAERSRVGAILGLDEAKGREAQANALIAAGLDATAAATILAAAPKAGGLASRMSEDQPALGGPHGQDPKPSPSASWNKHVDRQNARLI